MKHLLQISDHDLYAYWGLSFGLGIVLLILGLLALSAIAVTTIVTVVFLGVLLVIGGLLLLIDTFAFWWGRWFGFSLHLLVGALYFFVGTSLVYNPVLASASLTLMLAIFYVFVGVFRIVYAFTFRLPRWEWQLFNGAIALLIGLLIAMNWPASSLLFIGLFVGIDLIFAGVAFMMAALRARSLLTDI